MNRKIIIVITVLICLCAAAITVQHFANKNTENTTAPTESSGASQVDTPSENAAQEDPTDENSPSNNDKTESVSQTAEKEQNTATTTKAGTATTTKPNTTTTTKTNTTSTTKPNTTTTTKPNTTTTTKPATEAEKKTIKVTISISCEKALDYGKDVPKYFLSPCEYTAKQGDTAFDVLEAAAKENGITLKYQNKSYIQAINGLAEKDCGGGSGWTYRINGEKPLKSAAKYELSDGDVIEWYYALSPSD